MMNNKASTLIFKHNNKWYKLSLRIDETDVTPKDISEKKIRLLEDANNIRCSYLLYRLPLIVGRSY